MQSLIGSIIEEYGLDPNSKHVERVKRELEYLGIEDEKILEKIALSELDVGESYFFRDRGTWKSLKRFAMGMESVKILSLGCAEGEEVYTAAFVLRDAGIEYEILGVDACSERIEIASRGIYSPRKLRTMSKEEIRRYFKVHDGKYEVREEYRKGTSFMVSNIVEIIPPGEYDFILLRRVLIYLDPESIDRVLKKILNRLKSNGYLILGKGEVYREMFEMFEPVPAHGAIFWKKRSRWIEPDISKRLFEISMKSDVEGEKEILKEMLNKRLYDQVEYLAEMEINSGRKSPDIWKYLITALIYKDEIDKAKDRLKTALEIYPSDEDLLKLKRVIF